MNRTMLAVTALGMSIGWGIRGQFGHEYGAAMAGALGGMAVAMLAGRQDWARRVHYFGALTAIGWAFGGSMSYMLNVAYAHSPDVVTLYYGFAALFLIGALWAAPGGAFCALAAVWNREQLTSAFVPLSAVLGAWLAQDIAVDLYTRAWKLGSLNWHDSDWLGAASALAAVLITAAIRRRIDPATSLVIYMATGWWAGFLVLVAIADLHLNPPRGDNWAGCVGMVAGIFAWAWRQRLPAVTHAAAITGVLGGAGFVLGHILKLAVIATDFPTNTHSVMEQLQGLFHGVALAIAMSGVATAAEEQQDEPRSRRWTEIYSVVFIIVGIVYVNFRKSPADWVSYVKSLQPELYGLPITGLLVPSRGWFGWFEIFFLALTIAICWLLRRHQQAGVAFIPASWRGRGELLFLVFLWTITWVNLAHVIPRLAEQRVITEWVIAMNAIVTTVLLLSANAQANPRSTAPQGFGTRRALLIAAGIAGTLILLGPTAKQILVGESSKGSSPQIRFGPSNTNEKRSN